MKTQTAFAWLVVLVALVILGVALGPAISALATHGPHTDPSLTLLLIGIGGLFLGGWLLPSSRVGPVLKQASVLVGPYLPFGRRAYDNPPAHAEPPAAPREPPADP
jgi:hypothetical protein